MVEVVGAPQEARAVTVARVQEALGLDEPKAAVPSPKADVPKN